MINHLAALMFTLITIMTIKTSWMSMFCLVMIHLFWGSSALIKKLLMLEMLSIMMTFGLIMSMELMWFNTDIILILTTFLVIDAVIGLALMVVSSRKSSAQMKISKFYWLCS